MGSGAGEHSITPQHSAAWDLSRIQRLSLRVSRVKLGSSAIRLRWLIESRVGGLYSSASVVPIGSGTAKVSLALDPDDTDLIPDGHARPWDLLSAAEVLRIELRAECHGASNAQETAEL